MKDRINKLIVACASRGVELTPKNIAFESMFEPGELVSENDVIKQYMSVGSVFIDGNLEECIISEIKRYNKVATYVIKGTPQTYIIPLESILDIVHLGICKAAELNDTDGVGDVAKDNLKDNEKLIVLYYKANAIIDDEDLNWEEIYDLIFSPKISGAIINLTGLTWYDPDTSYCEDVMAFMDAFSEYMDLNVSYK